MANCSKAELEYILNHVVLPPKLPHQLEVQDFIEKAEEALVNELLSVLDCFLQQCAPEFKAPWTIVRKMLVSCWTAKLLGDLSEKHLTQAMLAMEPGDALPVRIRAQNAAIIFRRAENATILECFELSPRSEDVIRCKGSLRRRFPAQAVAISQDVANDASFCCELFATMTKLDLEVVHEMMPKSRKAKQEFSEFRDTCHPGLVSELIMATVAAMGAPVETFQIQKRIRDDVIWDQCLLPWRRSTLWLILRVAIHTTLLRNMEPAQAHAQFKNFTLYFMTDLLKLTADRNVALDVCKILQMKIARRALKLGASVILFVEEAALTQTNEMTERQVDIWQQVQAKDAERHIDIDITTLENDTGLTLLNSRAALDTALREGKEDSPWIFVSLPADYHEWITFDSDGLPHLNEAIPSRPEKIYALSEYEKWVGQSLVTWLETALLQPTAMQCTSIHRCADYYNGVALELYSTSPQQLSVMLLTLGDLWYALDRIAGALIPLLHCYSPGMSAEVFDVLLLPQKAQMQRLQRLQMHITARHQNTQSRSPSVFSDPSYGDPYCFAYKYFGQSIIHQNLRQRILADAKTRREEKTQEWQTKSLQYKALTAEMNSLNCDTRVDYDGETVHNDASCRKCDLKHKAQSLSIAVFEWPLPEDETQSRLVVMHLRCPEVLAAWQNLTWVLVNDLGREKYAGGVIPKGRLTTFAGLAPYHRGSDARLVLASTTKSVTVSHYRQTGFPVELEKVFSEHGLHYKLFDNDRYCWVGDQTTEPSFFSKCRNLLTEVPYKNLQYAVDSTSHSQNDVLAAQIECSPDLSIHEYIAFASLRADGEKTQWLNICRQLRASTLSWNTDSTCSLIKQSAWQACSIDTTTLRTAHKHFESIDFTIALLSSLEDMVESIQANRQCHQTMDIVIILALRTLSLAVEYNDLAPRCLALLQRCRSVVFLWITATEDTLRVATDPDEITHTRCNLLTFAMLCKLTFDVDECYCSRALTTSEDLLYWTFASIVIEDNTPGTDSNLSHSVRVALIHHTKLSHRYQRQVYQLLSTSDNDGLDRAIRRVWSSFHCRDHNWEPLVQSDARWVYKQTLAGTQAKSQKVSYNILSGALLVDGRPLGSLPKDYTSHPGFIRLFGAQILRIATSDMAGMRFMTATEEYGYRFYLDLRGVDLIVKAKNASTILELISHERFIDDFPTMFVEDFTHWFDLTTDVLEFRPLDRPWTSDINNWRLTYQAHGVSFLQNGQHRLVDIRSQTCQRTVSVFDRLETSKFTHITRSTVGQLHVFLPRLGFHFVRNNSGELECQELRKIVSQDQSLGTLIGLKNRLVLCARGDRSMKLDRLVLIPEGAVSTRTEGRHVAVHITTAGRSVHCFRFRYNSILNRLEGDASVVCCLYQAYLHALTSFILPDPLTGHLGMEQSVNILNEQVFRCCKPLNSDEIKMLNLIIALTPQRVFYPTHLQAMQQIWWHKTLSPLVQNAAFFEIAQRILAHSERFTKFYPDLQPTTALESRGAEHLLQRARTRQSTYMNADYGGDECTCKHDQNYEARDQDRDCARFARVYSMSSFVNSWTGDMTVTSDLAPIWKSWGKVAGFGGTFDTSQPVADLLKLDLALSWGSLYQLCRDSTREKSLYKLTFLFAQLSYGSKPLSPNDLKTLLAFASNRSLQSLPKFPSYGSFELRSGSVLLVPKLRSIFSTCVEPFEVSRPTISTRDRQQEHAEYKRLSSANIDAAVIFYENQWPCRQPTPVLKSSVRWLNVNQIKRSTESLFAEWYKNRECQQHLAMIRGVIDTTMTSSFIQFPFTNSTWQRMVLIPRFVIDTTPRKMSNLMEARSSDAHAPSLPSVLQEQQPMEALEVNPYLRSLVTGFGVNANKLDKPLRSRYKNDLLGSLDALEKHLETVWPDQIASSDSAKVSASFDTCLVHLKGEFNLLCSHLQPKEPIDHLLKAAGLWPRLCIRDFCALIASVSCTSIPKVWKDSIIAVGIGITALQRTRRLVLAAEKGDTLSFSQEMANPGQSGWTAYENPDWLLIEIENDLLIRPVQVKVAMEMIAPSSSSNTLMQLNMGEGKSSVITPLIAATLADKSRLVRVVVLRSLTRQMQDTLIQRLGGLVNRPVYFMPFSRKTSIDEAFVAQMQSMYIECMAKGGVLITQPEHILSFKLMGIERVASEDYGLGAELMKTQTWLDDNCRDVLDESDEILDVKFQLIYTLGAPRNMDGQPDRWLMMQGVFDIVQKQAQLLQEQHPRYIEIEKRRLGSFSSIRLLSAEARNSLISAVAENICESELAGLVMSALPPEVSKAVPLFIKYQDVPTADCESIQSHCTNSQAYLKKIMLVRGLIACGILIHVLHDKRWSVTYGLHPTRCLCAVPYRAKGIPAPTAEFGHPDVAIALTCLSYYYTGLTDDQLRLSLEILQKADDPSDEYGTWMREDRSFPSKLRSWNAVNLEDRRQCKEILFPALKFNKKVADFFMNNVVFPKEGKEFDQKLSTSGWDIPAKPHSKHVTTGFSGTNDNRVLLPSSISQQDLPELRHTSAMVLAFLLRQENLFYTCAMDDKGCQLSSQALIECIIRKNSSIRVLIDVGAQILDLSNSEVIALWLALDETADAGVFFSADDHAMVLDRDGNKEALATSSYASRMDRCVVYLDDVHTRGTDLRLPLTARAAVTLGPRLTKDRLVQACMRLRQLGHGQSLMYVASPEVHHSIVETTSASPIGGLSGRNVVEWVLEQSCLQIERNQPLRIVQGLSYYQRQDALDVLKQRLVTLDSEEGTSVGSLGDQIIEHEAQSLHDLYAPDAMRDQTDSDLIKKSRSESNRAVQELVRSWDQLNPHASRNGNLHEELEREVGHEVEQETQIERPPKATPEKRNVDPRLINFINSGTFLSAACFSSVYYGIAGNSSASRLLIGRNVPWGRLRVTDDFIKTIKGNTTIGAKDDYLRPVQWLLVSKVHSARDIVLIISQYEVNECLDLIQSPSPRVTLISYEPRVTRSMPSFDDSPLQSLPGAKEAWNTLDESLRQELHLFAGQLYFTTFEEYQLLVKSITSENAAPNDFIREWIGIRRKGQNFLQTHVGKVTSGSVLPREVFETGDEDAVVAGER